MKPSELRQRLTTSFDMEEFKDLCFDLSVDFDSLPSQGKNGKIRDLLQYIATQNRVKEFCEKLQVERPKVSWPNQTEQIKNLTREINQEIKWRYLKNWATAIISTLTLIGVVLIISIMFVQNSGFPRTSAEVFQIPPSDFNILEFGDEDWNYHKIAIEPHSDRLWITAYDRKFEQWRLFYLDTKQEEYAGLTELENSYLQEGSDILNLYIDCFGSIWILLNEQGPLIIQETEENSQGLLIADVLALDNENLTGATQISSRCEEDAKRTTVWIGYKSIISLEYAQDSDIEHSIQPSRKHDIDINTLDNEIVALHYDSQNNIVWVISHIDRLFGFPLNGLDDPIIQSLGNEQVESIISDEHREIWLGGNGQLLHGQNPMTIDSENGLSTIISRSGEVTFGSVNVISIVDRRKWFGTSCYGENDNCYPLGIVDNYNLLQPIILGTFRRVIDIEGDNKGGIWILTENGLVYGRIGN